MKAQEHPCPSAEALARASVSAALDPALSAHLSGCARCASAMEDVEALRALSRRLPAEGLAESRVQSVRTALIARAEAAASSSASSSPSPSPWRVAAAVAVAAALIGVAVAGWWPSAPSVGSLQDEGVRSWRGRVHGHEGARFLTVSGQPDEIVRLIEGRLTVEVEALSGAERLRVVTNDAEVEVRGAVFDIEARADALVAVHVLQGEVEVRPLGRPSALLKAGQRWAVEVEAGAQGQRGDALAVASGPGSEGRGAQVPAAGATGEGAAPAKVVVEGVEVAVGGEGEGVDRQRGQGEGVRRVDRAARGRRRGAVRLQRERAPSLERPEAALPRRAGGEPRAIEPSESERAFQRGWQAMREGDHAAAASAFERAAVDADGRLVEDASFWRGVALDRAGERGAAAAQLEGFLRSHPGSSRAGSASAMAGWMRLKEGDLVGARGHFERAAGDADPKVQASARAGLAQVARREATR